MKKDLVFINDKVVKKILNSEEYECREYLIRIISSITKIDPNLLRDNIELVTPEVSSNANTVNSIVDAVYKSDKEYFNIEINYNKSHIATVKNNIYLYNLVLRQVKNNKDYKDVMPVIQININNYDLFGKNELIYETMMMEVNHNIIRDKMIKIYDINLEKLIDMDYNEIKKGNNYNLSKILYIFICKDKKVLDYIYDGDKVMEKVRNNFKDFVTELDEMLYYDPEDLNRQILEYETEQAQKRGYEEGHKKGIEEGIKEGIEKGIEKGIEQGIETVLKSTIKNMLENNLDDEQIIKYLNIHMDELVHIKKEL